MEKLTGARGPTMCLFFRTEGVLGTACDHEARINLLVVAYLELEGWRCLGQLIVALLHNGASPSHAKEKTQITWKSCEILRGKTLTLDPVRWSWVSCLFRYILSHVEKVQEEQLKEAPRFTRKESRDLIIPLQYV